MPYVHIKLAQPETPLSLQQKEELISGATNLRATVLKRDPKSIMVEITENSPDNWGVGGKLLSHLRQKAD